MLDGDIGEDISLLLNEPFWDKLSNSHVLVTGATGQLGTFLIMAIESASKIFGLNCKIMGLCRDKKKANILFGEMPNVNLLFHDIVEPLKCDYRFDYIIHTAGPVGPALFASNPVDVLSANTTGTINLLNYAVKHDCDGFIFASTHEVYGNIPEVNQVIELDENSVGTLEIMNSRSCYGQGKRAAETALSCYSSQYGIRAMSARLSRFYGPQMNLNSGLFICDFVKNILRGEDIAVKGDATLMRPLCYISDVASAMLYILAYGKSNEAYNVQNDEPLTIGRIAEELMDITGVPISYCLAQSTKKNPHGQILATEKLRKIGWKPRISFRQGIKRTLEYLDII